MNDFGLWCYNCRHSFDISRPDLLENAPAPKQKVLWIDQTSGLISHDLSLKPTRVWTLVYEKDENKVPSLPIHPVHDANAFLEDEVHDWNWRRRKFRYYSRVTSGKVWILLEYGDAVT